MAGELELCGTLGCLYPGAEARGCKIVPSQKGQFQHSGSPLEAEQMPAVDGDLTHQHIRNFLDCVRSRKRCHCDLETGHRSTTFALLANLALATGTRIQWDPVEERVLNPASANDLLSYEYRAPWRI